MSGHSKWSTIKRKKALVDAKRSKVWTKIIKEITVAARLGGGDPTGNPRLRLSLDKARAANMTKDAIKRAIDKGCGASGGGDWEEVVYEGYGPGGVAIVVECMTDNRNRTVSEVRQGFVKHNGNMGNSGSVSWMFNKRGLIHLLKDAATEEQLMEVALDAGAEDVRDEEEVWVVDCDPSAFMGVKDAIEAAGLAIEHAELDSIPDNRTELSDEDAVTLAKMLGFLEDLDDVQNVYSNYEVSDEMAEELGL